MQSQLQTANHKISFFPLIFLFPPKLHTVESNTAVYSQHESEARAWLQKPVAYDKMMAQSNGRNVLKTRLGRSVLQQRQGKEPVNTVRLFLLVNIGGCK